MWIVPSCSYCQAVSCFHTTRVPMYLQVVDEPLSDNCVHLAHVAPHSMQGWDLDLRATRFHHHEEVLVLHDQERTEATAYPFNTGDAGIVVSSALSSRSHWYVPSLWVCLSPHRIHVPFACTLEHCKDSSL